MALTPVIGKATFTNGGSETATFTWKDAITQAPVTLSAAPTPIGGPTLTVTTGGQGPGLPFLNGTGALTASGGTITMANPPDGTVVIAAIGS